MVDWTEVRANRFSTERPTDWPEGVFAVSIKGTGLIGVHEKSGKLFWDGKELVTRSKIRLGTLELWLVGIAASGTFGTFIVDAGRVLGWWH
jgi:hypothetical protein